MITRPPPPRSSQGRRQKATSLLGVVIAAKYRLLEVVGLGGTGAVFRAEEIGQERSVAIKLLHPDTEGFSLLAMRMEREAMAGCHLRHPNIASALDFGSLADGTRYLVTELVRGRTLREVMKEGPMPMDRAALFARQICDALRACHARGVVHRDLKPLNVMVDDEHDGRARLIDFGLARIPARHLVKSQPDAPPEDEAPTLENLTLHGLVFGTVAYMAPETAQGMAAVNERSDLYALGVILYELVAGVHPFSAEDPVDLFLQHRLTPPPPLRERAPKVVVPAAFEAIVMRLLAKRPEDRFPSAQAVLEALERSMAPAPHVQRAEMVTPMSSVLSEAETRPSDAPSTPLEDEPFKPKRRSRGVLAFAGLVAAATLVWAVSRRTTEAQPAASPFIARTVRALPPVVVDVPDDSPRLEAVARFREAYELERWQTATSALQTLLDLDASALTNEDDWRRARHVALRGAFGEAPGAERLFDTIAERSGVRGIELLYDIVESQGGSRGAALAWERLKRPDVRARFSPALTVAVDIRLASCRDKPQHFERAAQVGDARAYRVLGIIGAPRCMPHRGECCWGRHQGLKDALRAIEDRESAH